MISNWIAIVKRAANIVGIAAITAVSVSGLAMLFGTIEEGNKEISGLMGLRYESWLELHEPAAIAFVLAVLLHLVFHLRRIVNLCKQCIRNPKRLVKEPALLLIIIVLVLMTAVVMPDESGEESGDDCAFNGSILGNITTYLHASSGALVAIVLFFHISRRRNRIIYAS